jgi:hypothetical protein
MCRAVVGMAVLAAWLSASGQGLIRRIESPETTFQDERKNWIGQDIRFLHQERAEQLGKYVGFCWDPEKPRSSIVEYARLAGRCGRIEEAWVGSVVSSSPQGQSEEEIVAFWKIRLIESSRAVWYWDDGVPYIDGVGFIRDYEAAGRHVGDSLWTKQVSVLYTMDDASVVRLRNLQKVVLSEVRWSEHANYPLKFVLKTDKGEVGYRPGTSIDAFLDEWHTTDPRRLHGDWSLLTWMAIENRKLTTGMTPDMVHLAWGNPMATDLFIAPQGNQLTLSIYHGLNKRIYGLFFINGRLVTWQWNERKHQNQDRLRFVLNHERVNQTCDVLIEWQNGQEGGKETVTFYW